MTGVNHLENNNMMPYGGGGHGASPQARQPLQPVEDRNMPCTTYPEIYYRLAPYIMMVCDQAESAGVEMPSQQMIESITDSIYDDMVRNFPDMADYFRGHEQTMADVDSLPVQGPFYFGRRPRRRGLFRDLIDILLLNEFLRRRRRRRLFFG